MSKFDQFFSDFKATCLGKNVPYEIISEGHSTKIVLVRRQYKNKSQRIRSTLKESAHNTGSYLQARAVDNGIVFVLSSQVIDEDDMSTATFEANTKYNNFRSKLDTALCFPEDQYKTPSVAKKKSDATEQYPARFKKRHEQTLDDKIDEAFEGMATPDDIQPQEALKALLGAMKDSGLAGDLKKAGISWHVAEPGKHVITFNKGDTPIIQKSTIELAEPKDLGELLSHLRSVANGQAPQAGLIELDLVQQQAKDASAKKKQLDDIATQYTAGVNPADQEQQVVQPTLAAGKIRSGKVVKEGQHKCPGCTHVFSTPDWLDTQLRCPKCKQPVENSNGDHDKTGYYADGTNNVHPADREWGAGERNHYLGRDSSYRN